MASEQSNRIWIAFRDYVQSGDDSTIGAFTLPQIEMTLIQYTSASEVTDPVYKAIQRKIDELKEQQKTVRQKRDLWIDRVITFVLGVAAGLLVAYVVWKLKWQ